MSRPWTENSCQISGWISLEIKCTGNVMSLNYPEPSPHTLVHRKIVFQDGGGIGWVITFSSTNSLKEQQNGEQSLQNNF